MSSKIWQHQCNNFILFLTCRHIFLKYFTPFKNNKECRIKKFVWTQILKLFHIFQNKTIFWLIAYEATDIL